MKTFQEFILEAILTENDQQEFARLGAQIRMLRSRGRPGDDEKIKELTQRASEFQMGAQAKIGAEIGDKDREDERENTYITGKPSKPKDTRARGGSLPNIPSSDGEGEDTSTGGRFGDRRSGRSGGVRGQSRNNATARNLGHLGSKS